MSMKKAFWADFDERLKELNKRIEEENKGKEAQ